MCDKDDDVTLIMSRNADESIARRCAKAAKAQELVDLTSSPERQAQRASAASARPASSFAT